MKRLVDWIFDFLNDRPVILRQLIRVLAWIIAIPLFFVVFVVLLVEFIIVAPIYFGIIIAAGGMYLVVLCAKFVLWLRERIK